MRNGNYTKMQLTTIVPATQRRRSLCVCVLSRTKRFETTFMLFLSAFLLLCLNAAEAGWVWRWQLAGYEGLSKASSEESPFLTPHLAGGLMFRGDLSTPEYFRIMQRKSGSKPVVRGGKCHNFAKVTILLVLTPLLEFKVWMSHFVLLCIAV